MLETTELRAFLTRIDGPTARNGSGAGLSPFYLVKTACYGVKLRKRSEGRVIHVTFSDCEARHNSPTFPKEGIGPEVHDADQPATRKIAAD